MQTVRWNLTANVRLRVTPLQRRKALLAYPLETMDKYQNKYHENLLINFAPHALHKKLSEMHNGIAFNFPTLTNTFLPRSGMRLSSSENVSLSRQLASFSNKSLNLSAEKLVGLCVGVTVYCKSLYFPIIIFHLTDLRAEENSVKDAWGVSTTDGIDQLSEGLCFSVHPVERGRSVRCPDSTNRAHPDAVLLAILPLAGELSPRAGPD